MKTLAIHPEYLATLDTGEVTDFCEWTVPLGRRFRALKLWFLLRAYGLEGLRGRIRNHIAWAEAAAVRIGATPGFEIVTAPALSLFSFRHAPQGVADLDALNRRLVKAINADGRIYLTQTVHQGRFAIRFQVGQFRHHRGGRDAGLRGDRRDCRKAEVKPNSGGMRPDRE